MAKDYKYARDKDGKIMKDYKDRPMLASHFVNEPDSTEYLEAGLAKSDREVFEEMLAQGIAVPEDLLHRKGFRKVDGKWVYHGKPKAKKSRRCPECGSGKRVRIRYGLPGPDRPRENDKRPEWMKVVILGGCCIDPLCPKWYCTDCGHEWGELG